MLVKIARDGTFFLLGVPYSLLEDMIRGLDLLDDAVSDDIGLLRDALAIYRLLPDTERESPSETWPNPCNTPNTTPTIEPSAQS